MALLTDETLMAYADGELDTAAKARVETILTHDVESRDRLKIFAATGAPLAALYSVPMEQPVPPHLVALVLNGREGQKSPRIRGAAIRTPKLKDTVRALFGWPAWPAAVAACAAILMLGTSAGWYLHRASNALEGLVSIEHGQLFAEGPLKTALETSLSGAKVQLTAAQQGDVKLTMRTTLTFRNRSQAYCRQYDVTSTDAQYAGVACRAEDGQWRLELHMAVAPHSVTHDHMMPAGANGAEDVEKAVASLIEGDALGHADEEALIRKKWQR